MVFNWLDATNREDLDKDMNLDSPVQFQSPEDVLLAKERGGILREFEYVAAMFGPYARDTSGALRLKPISR
jgi:hypothetical protein